MDDLPPTIADAVMSLFDAYGIKPIRQRCDAYHKHLRDPEIERWTLRALEEAPSTYDRLPSIAQVKQFRGKLIETWRREMEGTGYRYHSRGTRLGAKPFRVIVPRGGYWSRMHGDNQQRVFRVDEDGSLTYIGQRVPDEKGVWHYLPQGKTHEDIPTWNRGLGKDRLTAVEYRDRLAKRYPGGLLRREIYG